MYVCCLRRGSEAVVGLQRQTAGKADEMVARFSGKEELCRNLEQQIAECKQNSIRQESEVNQLKKSLDIKDEALKKCVIVIIYVLYCIKVRSIVILAS